MDHSTSERRAPNCTITGLIHLADPAPRDILIPLDVLGLAAQACLLPQSRLADHILLDALNQAALVYLHRLWDPSFIVGLLRSVMRSSITTDLTHLAGLTHLGHLCHRLCPQASLIPSLVERLQFNPLSPFGDAENYE